MSSQKPFTTDLVVRLLTRIFRHFNAIDESSAVDVLLVLLRCPGRGSGDRIDITPHNLRCTLQAMCHAPYSMHTRPKWPRDIDGGARTSHATFALRILKLPVARATWLDCSCAAWRWKRKCRHHQRQHMKLKKDRGTGKWMDMRFAGQRDREAMGIVIATTFGRHQHHLLAALMSRHTSNSFTCPRGSCGARTFFCACPATDGWTCSWTQAETQQSHRASSGAWCSHFRKVGFQGRWCCDVTVRCENSLQRCRLKCGHHRLSINWAKRQPTLHHPPQPCQVALLLSLLLLQSWTIYIGRI